MLVHEVAEVHQVQLVAGQDEHLARIRFEDPVQVLAHGVGSALVPVAGPDPLLGREDVDVSLAEVVEPVGLRDVTMEARAQELRHHVDALDAGVQTVADRDVDQPELTADRNGRLGSVLRQRPEAQPLTATENR